MNCSDLSEIGFLSNKVLSRRFVESTEFTGS